MPDVLQDRTARLAPESLVFHTQVVDPSLTPARNRTAVCASPWAFYASTSSSWGFGSAGCFQEHWTLDCVCVRERERVVVPIGAPFAFVCLRGTITTWGVWKRLAAHLELDTLLKASSGIIISYSLYIFSIANIFLFLVASSITAY